MIAQQNKNISSRKFSRGACKSVKYEVCLYIGSKLACMLNESMFVGWLTSARNRLDNGFKRSLFFALKSFTKSYEGLMRRLPVVLFIWLVCLLTFRRTARGAGRRRFPRRVSLLVGPVGRVRGNSVLHHYSPRSRRGLLGSDGKLSLQFRHIYLR